MMRKWIVIAVVALAVTALVNWQTLLALTGYIVLQLDPAAGATQDFGVVTF